MNEPYFSDRELGPQPQTHEEISGTAWGGIIAAIESYIADGSFGYRYPLNCQDGRGPYGCNEDLFFMAMRGDIPEFPKQLLPEEIPPTFVILDVMEFCYRNIAEPTEVDYHSFYGHSHLEFDVRRGQVIFRNRINRIFSRNGIAYQLEEDGCIVRLLPQEVQEPIASMRFRTGDPVLDDLLRTARNKFFDRDPNIRRESLEKLWDAWERLKTIENPENKKESIRLLLDKVDNGQQFRDVLENDAINLTAIGNDFMIRHSEIGKSPVQSSEQVDYFFQRLFAIIWLLLRATNRG